MRIPAAAAVAPCHLSTGAKRVTSSGKKILICRSPGSGEPGPGTTAYVTPTHSHRRSCPASPGKPGPGAAAGAVAGFQRARRSLSASSPDVPAGRAQRRQRHAGRASLAGGQVVLQALRAECPDLCGLRRDRPRGHSCAYQRISRVARAFALSPSVNETLVRVPGTDTGGFAVLRRAGSSGIAMRPHGSAVALRASETACPVLGCLGRSAPEFRDGWPELTDLGPWFCRRRRLVMTMAGSLGGGSLARKGAVR